MTPDDTAPMTLVKICGLKNESLVATALEAGADRVGFVLVAASPRAVDFATTARLAEMAHRAGREAWVVAAWSASGSASGGPTIPDLDRFVADTPAISAVQLHGRETPADVADLRARLPGRRIVKAIGVSTRADLGQLANFPDADAFLLDAKPPSGAAREGGFGTAFDWSILSGFRCAKPWVLSGGLTPENVAAAIALTGATEVDVSSGVEGSPGVKDPAKVRAFVRAAKSL
jgi:phosphoribosylanthranilate isomerase